LKSNSTFFGVKPEVINEYFLNYLKLAAGRWFSPDTPVSSTIKTDRRVKHHQTKKQT
jgi:hypothetical protein